MRGKKKEREHRQQQLENTIRKLEQQHKLTPTPALLTELTVACRYLTTLLSNVMEGRLRFVKQKYYEYVNRSSSSLPKETIIHKHSIKAKI